MRRLGFVSEAPHRKAGGNDREAPKDGMKAVRGVARHYALYTIFNVDGTGLSHKALHRRTYISGFDGRKPARGTKDMGAKDIVLVPLGAIKSGTL